MLKRTILALSVAALATTGVALAQENATLLMRSGEKVSGQLIDMGGVGFTIRVNGQERQIPTNDVAVIDFTGNPTDTDWSKIASGQQVVILRNGQTIDGSLYDISGAAPLKITIRTSSGEREFSSSEIGRIVLARPTNAVATSGSTGVVAGGAGFAVPANQRWISTGLTVRRGETLTFNTTGQVQLGPDSNDTASSAGSNSGRYAPASPLPRALAGALIGRIGNGQPFAIGNQTSVAMPAAGQLFLGINDDNVGDNQGEFRVEITRTGQIRR
jgi:hypothetical protein